MFGWLVSQRLRRGAAGLLADLAAAGHEIWVYTTSFRSAWAIRMLFFAYGIRLAGVVNQTDHDREAARSPRAHFPSKYPPAFGLDVLVDDNEGVFHEGQTHGFPVVRVAPSDADWANHVREALKVRCQE